MSVRTRERPRSGDRPEVGRGTAPPVTPALYETVIRHVRSAPVENSFKYRGYQWLVDVDQLPRLPAALRPLARFQARDHFGDPAGTLRSNVDRFLVNRGIDLRCGRIVMLGNARVFGYVFNPLSVFWCYDRSGELACVIAEVHNTYGERHCYLLDTDERGRATVPKEFYVSPFNGVEGEYQLSLPPPDDRLSLTVSLRDGTHPPFVASVRGHRRPGTTAQLLRLMARSPWETAAVTARIHGQGIRLWLRRLPIVPRPARNKQEDVQ